MSYSFFCSHVFELIEFDLGGNEGYLLVLSAYAHGSVEELGSLESENGFLFELFKRNGYVSLAVLDLDRNGLFIGCFAGISGIYSGVGLASEYQVDSRLAVLYA